MSNETGSTTQVRDKVRLPAGYEILSLNFASGTPYTIAIDVSPVIEVDGTAGAGGPGPMTLTLPTLATALVAGVGIRLWIVAPTAATQAITVDGNGAETINGAANRVLATNNQVVCLEAHSGDWKVIHDSTVVAGAGMTGGGTGGSTLNVIANADGSIVVNADDIQVGTITDAQHGTRAGGTLHADATGAVDGFMTSTDKTAHDAHVLALTNLSVGLTNSAAQTLTTSSFDPLTFNTERWDNGGLHESVTNPTRITIPAGGGGVYEIAGGVAFAANATGLRGLTVKLNGATIIAVDFRATYGGEVYLSIATQYLLVAGDYIQLEAYQSSGGNLNTVVAAAYSPEFRACRRPA